MPERRWMLFVDGENFAIRGEAVAKEHGLDLADGPYYKKGVFVWLPGVGATDVLAQPKKGNKLETYAVRAHYYTSVVGSPQILLDVRMALRDLGFQPRVFQRAKSTGKSKGVDITLTKDLLVNAFHNNYDVAVLVAGDGDYVPVVQEVMAMGKTVYVVFFTEPVGGLNDDLKLHSDKFFTLSLMFLNSWAAARKYLAPPKSPRETIDPPE